MSIQEMTFCELELNYAGQTNMNQFVLSLAKSEYRSNGRRGNKSKKGNDKYGTCIQAFNYNNYYINGRNNDSMN